MHLNYKVFKGISVQLHDLDKAEQQAAKIASSPGIRQFWPVQVYSIPKLPEGPSAGRSLTKRGALTARDSKSTAAALAPHIMAQVDRLHARGIKGKGIKIAIADTGGRAALLHLGTPEVVFARS